ncbi:VCBS repeat-containing protein, partial [Arthrospira platensis SPKY1]|nr:VCBS repeat-containing protein [Arthrospira platensis SPKY1]
MASSVIGVDIDGDTDLDIIASAKSDNKIVLWINNGANPPVFTAITIDNDFYGAYDVDAEDIDGDGLIDIIGVATEGNKLAWWKNLGSNTFSTVNIIDSSLDKAF